MGRNSLFSRRPSANAGLTLPVPGPAAPPATNHGSAPDLAHMPAMGADGRPARNAIGVIIEQRTIIGPQAGTPLRVHPLPGPGAIHASGEHGPATTPAGAPLAASSAAAPPTGAANQMHAGRSYQTSLPSHTATVGGPAIGGTAMIRPASSVATVGGSAKTVTGVISGANVRMRHP
jgi:hypothetical protein